MARNKMIFQNKKPCPRKVQNKTWSLSIETILSKSTGHINFNDLQAEERTFLGRVLDNPGYFKSLVIHTPQKENWKIILKEKEFIEWLDSCKRLALFFNGASKSNLSIVGAGGFIRDENGSVLISYELGLGSLSNNKAESYTLHKSLQMIKRYNVANAMVFGDSAIVISMMLKDSQIKNIDIHRIIRRCRILIKDMKDISFHHILRANNKLADSLAKKSCSRPASQMHSHDGLALSPLP